MLLAAGLVHMLPDASTSGGDLGTDFPLVFFLCGVSFLVSLFVEQISAAYMPDGRSSAIQYGSVNLSSGTTLERGDAASDNRLPTHVNRNCIDGNQSSSDSSNESIALLVENSTESAITTPEKWQKAHDCNDQRTRTRTTSPLQMETKMGGDHSSSVATLVLTFGLVSHSVIAGIVSGKWGTKRTTKGTRSISAGGKD